MRSAASLAMCALGLGLTLGLPVPIACKPKSQDHASPRRQDKGAGEKEDGQSTGLSGARRRPPAAMERIRLMRAPRPEPRLPLAPKVPSFHQGQAYATCEKCHRVGGGVKPLTPTHRERSACLDCHQRR